VEINSSFYRPHRQSTYEGWKTATPASFRFSVKMPRKITHECALRHAAAEVTEFYSGIEGLQPKLGAVLIQLPPSLEFSAASVRRFASGEVGHQPRGNGSEPVCRRDAARRQPLIQLFPLAWFPSNVLLELLRRPAGVLCRLGESRTTHGYLVHFRQYRALCRLGQRMRVCSAAPRSVI
jgi:hypothetical protein